MQSTSLGRPNGSILHRSVLVCPLHPLKSNDLFRWARSISAFFALDAPRRRRIISLSLRICILLAVARKSKFCSLVPTKLCNWSTHIAKCWVLKSWTCLHCASASPGLRESGDIDTPRGPPQVVLIYSWLSLACERMR